MTITESEIPDIHEPVASICERFGFTPEHVAWIEVKPNQLIICEFKLNEDGKKHIDPETGVIATETHTFDVRA